MLIIDTAHTHLLQAGSAILHAVSCLCTLPLLCWLKCCCLLLSLGHGLESYIAKHSKDQQQDSQTCQSSSWDRHDVLSFKWAGQSAVQLLPRKQGCSDNKVPARHPASGHGLLGRSGGQQALLVDTARNFGPWLPAMVLQPLPAKCNGCNHLQAPIRRVQSSRTALRVRGFALSDLAFGQTSLMPNLVCADCLPCPRQPAQLEVQEAGVTQVCPVFCRHMRGSEAPNRTAG